MSRSKALPEAWSKSQRPGQPPPQRAQRRRGLGSIPLPEAWSTPPPEGPEEERPGVNPTPRGLVNPPPRGPRGGEAWGQSHSQRPGQPPPQRAQRRRGLGSIPLPEAWSTPPPEKRPGQTHTICVVRWTNFPPPLVLIPNLPNLPNPAHGQAMLGSQLGIGSGVFPDALVPGSDPSSIAVTRPVHYVGHGLL